MKTIGIVLLFVFCSAFGGYCAYLQHKIGQNSKLLLEAMLKVKMQLRYSRPNKAELLNKISFSVFVEKSNRSYIDGEMFAIAKSYFDEMGSRDFNSEIESLEYTLTILDSRLNAVLKACNQNKKLYLSLGIIAGLFLVIVFI